MRKTVFLGCILCLICGAADAADAPAAGKTGAPMKENEPMPIEMKKPGMMKSQVKKDAAMHDKKMKEMMKDEKMKQP